MHIAHLELTNFRKLLAVRIDLADQKTILVGANNSGKTSAMLALRRFFKDRGKHFLINDITLSHWKGINKIGEDWIARRGQEDTPAPDPDSLIDVMPALDVWIHVGGDEFHYVSEMIPLLDWPGGLLGVRMRLEPQDVTELFRDYTEAAEEARKLRDTAKAAMTTGSDQPSGPTLWPIDLTDFLSRKFMQYFELRSYSLDPAKLSAPLMTHARPQELPKDAIPLDGFPFSKLIRVDEISAQRGFGEGDANRHSLPVAPAIGFHCSSVIITPNTSTPRKDQIKQIWVHS